MTPSTTLPTWILVAAIGIIAAATGLLVLGSLGMVLIAIGFGVVVARRRAPASRATALRLLRARALTRLEAPQLVDTVGALAARAGLADTPTVALMDLPVMNAVATGEGRGAVVAVTPSLLRGLTPRQVVGVLAHEISHLRGRDLRVLAVARSLASFTQTLSLFATFLLFLVGPSAFAGQLSTGALLAILWAPTAATLLLLALSRAREHAADAQAAQLTGDPEGLAQALWTLERQATGMWEGTAGGRGMVPELLRTHPTTASRVARLHQLALRDPRMPSPAGPLTGAR